MIPSSPPKKTAPSPSNNTTAKNQTSPVATRSEVKTPAQRIQPITPLPN
jgi:hypothetical protein